MHSFSPFLKVTAMALCLLCLACASPEDQSEDYQSDNGDGQIQPDSPIDENQAEEDEPVVSGPGGFLWKPISDSTGNCVVLAPAYNGIAVVVDRRTGEILDEGVRNHPSNGRGTTSYLSMPGCEYQDVNVLVIDRYSGTLYECRYIEDGCQRSETETPPCQ
jgi:hypothetical protein